MNKATQKKIFNGNSIKEMNKFPVFNGGNAALGNIISKIGSNTLISSGSVSNALRPGTNIFSTHNLNTVATNTNINTNTNANINSGSHSVFSGLTTVLSDGKSNNKENTVNTGLKAELLIPVTHTNDNNLNGQINNGQLNNFQSTNNQLIIGGQSSNDQFTNAQSTNSGFFNAQSTTGLVNSQFSSGQSTTGQVNAQFNSGQSQDSHSKPSAIVNFIDPSSGNIHAMTREEFCDDKSNHFYSILF